MTRIKIGERRGDAVVLLIECRPGTEETVKNLCDAALNTCPEAHAVNTWDIDDIQFPRVIEEAQAAGAFTNEVMASMCDSMDVTRPELVELLERARVRFEKIKEAT